MTDQLLEAHSPSAFLSRVKDLRLGEVARLEGGFGVKHLALEDGRTAYKVGEPRGWGSSPDELEWYGQYRVAEDAVKEAMRRSARSTDPDSIGGTVSISTWGPYVVGAEEVRVRDFTTDGRAVVGSSSGTGGTRTVDPSLLVKRSPISLEALREAETGKPGTNWKQVTPENRRRIGPIVKHYMKDPHPFTSCVRDNTKRFGAERAKRICAVVKDLGRRTTRWRKGSATEAEVTEAVGRLLEAAGGDADAVEFFMLAYIAEQAQVAESKRTESGRERHVPSGRFTRPIGGVLPRAPKPESKEPEEEAGEPAEEAATNRARRGDSDYGVKAYKPSDDARGGRFDESKHKRAARGTSTGGQFVRSGQSGGAVRSVQSRLGIAATGTFDASTAAAVRAFQKRHGLQVDGVVGRQTALALSGQMERAKAATPGALGDYTRRLVDRGFRRPRAKRPRPERVGGGLLVK